MIEKSGKQHVVLCEGFEDRDFFRAIWRDEAVAGQLRKRLEKPGSWKTVVDLVRD